MLLRQRVAGQAQAQRRAADQQIEVAAGVVEAFRFAAGEAFAADGEAVLRLAGAHGERGLRRAGGVAGGQSIAA